MNTPNIKKIKLLDTATHNWCTSAMLVQVKNGKNTLHSVYSEPDYDYWSKGHLTLNGKPLVQGEYPAFPTCSAMLASPSSSGRGATSCKSGVYPGSRIVMRRVGPLVINEAANTCVRTAVECMAPRAGFEPATHGLTVHCATTAPPGNRCLSTRITIHERTGECKHNF